MNETDLQFRTAAFGGFQKQDVLAYLETSAKEQGEKLAALQRELEEEKQARIQAEERAAELEGRVSGLEEENQRLTGELTQRETELSEAAGRRDELELQTDDLAARVEKLTPAAAAYEAVKDRTAGIELEAHGRAQLVEAEAKRKAKKTREQMLEWFDKLQATYDRLQGDLNAAVVRAAGDLEQVNGALKGISGEFSGQDEALKAMREQLSTLDGPKAPKPLPLEEK